MYAKLGGTQVVPCDALDEWAAWFEKADRRVALTEICNSKVSTVFLGIDYGFGGSPLWFETMVFGGPLDQEQDRYATYEQAEEGHAAMVARVEAALSK